MAEMWQGCDRDDSVMWQRCDREMTLCCDRDDRDVTEMALWCGKYATEM